MCQKPFGLTRGMMTPGICLAVFILKRGKQRSNT